MVLNSLNFCLSGKLLISPSNLSESLLAGQSILGCRFFPFITLSISCHSLMACRFSVEKSADSLIGERSRNPDSIHGHHQMVNTKIRLIIFFAAKDGEALYSQQKQKLGADCGSDMNSLLPNPDLN